jgi:small-conductance mechanosensitive channel
VIIIITAVVAILMTFERVRQLGLSILASAGILGIIVGFAAQRSIATIFAGFQIAITQPIRIDDVVIVEGEWGWIEEITLTYVLVRIWDLRRLVVPTSYFLDKPFQNWTRRSADILGTVFLYVDYSVPVEEIRCELHRLLAASSQWDGKVWNVQVTNCTERTVELRCLMSAADSPSAWDLRCEIREKLIDYIRQHHPDAFPKLRARIEAGPRGGAF